MTSPAAKKTRFLPKGLEILHEDQDVIVIEKPAGMLTIGTDTDKTRTVFYALNDYVRKGVAKSKNRVYVVHRLDRETSGLLVFARNERAKVSLQKQWEASRKTYVAVVHGVPSEPMGTITSYLTENKAFKVYSTHDRSQGKLARTSYRLLKRTADYALLEVELLTGRKHQIRVHLAEAGHAVVGDPKYSSHRREFKRLALHARQLSFPHPRSGETLAFTSPVPSYINSLIGGYGWEQGQP